MENLIRIERVAGRPIPIRGNDIDTDRIIPARFMKVVTFEGLGQYVFYDERFDAQGRAKGHVFDDPRFQAKGPRIAVVNKNFGCGSSREHAPQALLRWGIRALVGESFADIFFGNCVALGMPCVVAAEQDIAILQELVERHPQETMVVDLVSCRVTFCGRSIAVSTPEAARRQLLDGSWDATRILLQAEEEIRRTAERLPYFRNFADQR
jgi:3-isopropylmalate/(R)-2-methylmalate dehydratase small subunit